MTKMIHIQPKTINQTSYCWQQKKGRWILKDYFFELVCSFFEGLIHKFIVIYIFLCENYNVNLYFQKSLRTFWNRYKKKNPQCYIDLPSYYSKLSDLLCYFKKTYLAIMLFKNQKFLAHVYVTTKTQLVSINIYYYL